MRYIAVGNLEKKANELRIKAETVLAQPSQYNYLTAIPANTNFPYELQVHQVELEIQNESLHLSHLALEESRDRYVDLYEFAPIGYISISKHGMILKANWKATSLFGLKRNYLNTCRFSQVIEDEDKSRWQRQFSYMKARPEGDEFDLDMKFIHDDGSSFYANVNCLRMADSLDESSPLLRLTLLDITERKLAEKKLKSSYDQHCDILNTAIDGFWITDNHGHFLEVNNTYCQLTGYSEKELLRMSITDIEAVETAHETKNHIHQVKMSGSDRFESKHKHKDGHLIDVEISVQYRKESRKFVVFIRDITKNKLDEYNNRIAATTFKTQEAIMVTNASRIIIRVNDAFSQITGYAAEEAIGKNIKLLRSGYHGSEFYETLWSFVSAYGSWQGEMSNRRKNGEVYVQNVTISSVKDSHGKIMNYVATSTDITRRKAAEEEVHQLAYYDQLTKLPNRQSLLNRMGHSIKSNLTFSNRCAVLFIDLDNFKSINGAKGHHVGDMLLQKVADRLITHTRNIDIVYRLGGDEFAVLLENLNANALDAAIESVDIANKISTELNKDYLINDGTYQSSVSIGISVLECHEQTKESLLKQADIAMYQSKRDGRNQVRLFNQAMQHAINYKAEIESDLSAAMKLNQFELHYQVQMNNTKKPTGAEALIRWNHPKKGVILPSEFIRIAEDNGLIVPIGLWVLETACAQLKDWKDSEETNKLTLSINVSAIQMNHNDFVDNVRMAIVKYEINPELLRLELTESTLINNLESTITAMTNLNALGVRFELDDFGTGYSSLQHIKRLPIYQLKIDQSFIADISDDGSDKAIVRTIIAMADTLKLQVIAEGVETIEQKNILINKGCHQFQGHLFGKPMPIKEFEASLIK